MNSGQPLWLNIVLGAVPLVAALIAGAFALANTVDRRINRLKTLVDIYKDFPQHYNQDFVLQHLMFQELRAIDRASTPVYRWQKIAIFAGVAFWVTYTVIVSVPPFSQQHWVRNLGWPFVLAFLAGCAVVGYLLGVARAKAEKRELGHEARLLAADKLRQRWRDSLEHAVSGDGAHTATHEDFEDLDDDDELDDDELEDEDEDEDEDTNLDHVRPGDAGDGTVISPRGA